MYVCVSDVYVRYVRMYVSKYVVCVCYVCMLCTCVLHVGVLCIDVMYELM